MIIIKSATHLHRRLAVRRGLLVVLAAGIVGTTSRAQSFSSGSDASDGALVVAANQGTIPFDPFDQARWGRILDADGDGVYNFTTISIGQGTTLKMRGDKVNRPLYWLASGNVVISGIIDLSGASQFASDSATRREVALPGAGGYAGGAGGVSGGAPATAGEGPGGGSGGVVSCSGKYPLSGSIVQSCGKGGVFWSNRFLAPLVGGSGGEGATSTGPGTENGGAGGGALLIASSASIVIDGTIAAAGGNGDLSGGGSGGGVRLVAPTIAGSGTLNVAGGSARVGIASVEFAAVQGSSGWIRLEANQIATTFAVIPATNALTRGGLPAPVTLKPASSIRVTAIDGIPVSPNPTGAFQVADVTINKGTPVSIDIQASGIPPGTVVTLQVYPQAPVDPLTINLTAQATLAGSLTSSTATATLTFPFGFSRGWVRATWTQ